MLSRLRKAEDLTTKKVEEMAIHYDITTDYLYNRGFKIGFEEGYKEGFAIGLEEAKREQETKNKVAFVSSLLMNTDFDTTRIALLVGVDTDFVEKVKADMK